MATWRIEVPADYAALVNADTPQAVTEYLTAHGVAVQSVSVQTQPLTLVIVSPTDPTAALAGYAGEASAARQTLRQQAQTALQFAAAVEAGQSVTAGQAFTALAATIRVVEWAVQRDGGL